MTSNSPPSRGVFWIVLVATAGFAAALATAHLNDPTWVWTRASVLTTSGLVAALVLVLFVLWDGDRFWWAGRVLAGLIAAAFLAFAMSDTKGVLGFIALGVPASWYAFTGRFSLRPTAADVWQATWDARQAALADLFGPPDPEIYHSHPPFNAGGRADVMSFRGYVTGVTYVTVGLTDVQHDAEIRQVPNSQGNYEIMMCTRTPVPWPGPGLGELARSTVNGVIEAGDTMNVGSIADSSLEHVAFATPDLGDKQLTFLGRSYGLLLAIGITDAELRVAQAEGTSTLISRLRDGGVFPFTDPGRASVV